MSPDKNKSPQDSDSSAAARSPHTTNREYHDREHGREQSPTEQVGNPVEHVKTDPKAKPRNVDTGTDNEQDNPA